MRAMEAGYADALLRAALAQDCVKDIADELYAVAEAISRKATFFYNPRVTSKQHVAMLEGAFSGRVSPLVQHFLSILAVRRLLRALPAIQLHFDEMAKRVAGEVKVRLRMPYQPSEQLLGELKVYLAQNGLFPMEKCADAQMNVVLDKNLIGGFYAECAGRVLDASLRNRLIKAYLKSSQGV